MSAPVYLLTAAALLLSQPAGVNQPGPRCRSLPDRVGQCHKIHGRLAAHNGAPTFRIWIAGTHRQLGVVGRNWQETENGEMLPERIRATFGPNAFQTDIIADFEVCPITRERPGVMPFVCVVRADNLHVRRR